MKKLIPFALIFTFGCSKPFQSGTATLSNPIQLSSASFKNGQLTLNGSALDTVTGINVSQAGVSLPFSLLTQTAGALSMALSANAAIKSRRTVDVTLSSNVQALSASLSVDLSGTSVSNLTVSGNTSSLQPALPGTLEQLGGADATAARVQVDGYGAAPVISYRAALGTAAVPTLMTNGKVLGGSEFYGYGSTSYSSGPAASISAVTTQAWTDAAQGAALVFNTTPNGSTSAALTERMRIDNSGFVGIGTTTPSALLTVNGSGTVATFLDGANSCDVKPSVMGGVTCSSDERLKHDIQGVEDGAMLEKVLRLKSVTYRWRTGEQSAHTGFIAQQVQQIAPDLVNRSSNGYLQVSYIGFIPWITSAIKEIYKEFSASREEIEKLKAKNAELERRLEALEKSSR